MSETLLTVEDAFMIKGHGLVVTGSQSEFAPQVTVGDWVEILTPDGELIRSKINGIERFPHQNCFGETHRRNIAFSFQELLKEDAPRGSIIKLMS